MSILFTILGSVLFAIVAPILGCLLAGAERKISARMQGRVGPPLLQPYYDVRKLLGKENVSVSGTDGLYITCSLLFVAFAGGVFFTGGNFLMSAFIAAMANLLFIVAAFSTRSPYAEVGANREMLQVLAYEPMVLLAALSFALATGNFAVSSATSQALPPIVCTWPAFLGLLYVLTIKLRKSPFDLSSSHHAHQDIVKGITTEMSGPTLAKVEIMHWAESILFLGWIGVFFIWHSPLSAVLAIVVALIAWFFEILIDNNFARVKWQAMVKSAWIVALVGGGVTVVFLTIMPLI